MNQRKGPLTSHAAASIPVHRPPPPQPLRGTAARIGVATLRFDDGTTATVSAAPTLDPQEIASPARATRKVRPTVDSVVTGTSSGELCLGEVG